jgi:hypothetical protein
MTDDSSTSKIEQGGTIAVDQDELQLVKHVQPTMG